MPRPVKPKPEPVDELAQDEILPRGTITHDGPADPDDETGAPTPNWRPG